MTSLGEANSANTAEIRADADSERRVNRAVQTAREVAICDPGLADVKLRRFHRAMDALLPGEGEQVYDRLRGEGWYRLAADALARTKSASQTGHRAG